MPTAGGRYAHAPSFLPFDPALGPHDPEPAPGDPPGSAQPVPGSTSTPAAAPGDPVASAQPVPGSTSPPAAVGQDQTPTIRPTPVLTPIQGPLTLDGRYLGDISGEVDVQGEGLVDAARLLDLLAPVLGPELLATLRGRIAGQERVAMADLETAGFSLSFDTFALTFVANLSADARARREVSLAGNEVIDPAAFEQPAGFAAGANINLSQRYAHTVDEFAPLQAGVDGFATWGGFGGVTLTAGADYDGSSEEKWTRREIRLTKDIFSSAIRLTAGEFAPPVESYQGSQRFLGLSAARAYSTIRPFQNIRPSGRREFILEREAFVEVEVNGVIVERLRLAPGPYSLSDFPYGDGANTVRLLIDDDTGRREIAVFDLFGGSGLLDRGVMDFGVSAGVLEEGGQLEYGSTLASTGFLRYGLSDVLTVGANAQAANGRVQAGGLATWGSPIGLVQFTGAASHNGDTGDNGVVGAIDYLRDVVLTNDIDVRFIASAQATSRYFQNAFAEGTINRERWRTAAQALVHIRDYSVNLGAAFMKGRDDAPDRSSLNLSIGRSFGRFGLNLTIGRQFLDPGPEETRVGLSLTARLGGRWSSSARYESQDRTREVGVSRSSTGDLGDVSGSLRLSENRTRQTVSGDLRYINNRFEGQVISNRLVATTPGGRTTQESLWRAATFVGYADGAVAIGRPAREGFIIATRHRSLRDADLALTDGGGRAIARAGWFGPALAPINRAYGVNRVVVAVDPLPPGYDLGAGAYSTFPGYGSGYRMVVGSDASRTVMGVLTGPDGPIALVSGVIESVDGPADDAEPKMFFTNRGGRFVGDGLAPGRYRLVIQGAPVGEFVISEAQEGVVDVGEIRVQP